MTRTSVWLPAFFALATGLALPAAASGEEPAAESKATRVYIVQLRQPAAIAAREDREAMPGRDRATRNGRFDPQSVTVRSYGAGLVASHDQLLESVGAANAKLYSYRLAFNGFAARLTPAQAARLRADPSVSRVWEDRAKSLKTNASPAFLGLLDTSSGLRTARGLRGEGVVIGIIDSGITPDHPSFADREEKPPPRLCRSDFGTSTLLGKWLCARFKKPRFRVAYPPPPAGWNGTCEAGDRFAADDCNNKLIGARFYVQGFNDLYAMDQNEFLSPRDADGHGTHIASVAAGNRVRASLGGTSVATVSGMAPRARIAVYKACWLEPGATRASCAMSDLQNAIEDAIADGVDIINYSVGTPTGGPEDPDSLALLAATDAGVLAVAAAGNGGPDAGSIESPGAAPWVLTAAASSRAGQRFDNVLRVTAPTAAAGDFSAKEAAFTPTLLRTGAIGARLVLADDGLSGDEGTRDDACQELQNAAGIAGRIALVRRGLCTFQEKIANVQAAGAVAAVVYGNTTEVLTMTGERDSVTIPAVMIGKADGEFLVARLDAGDAVEATLDKSRIVARTDAGNVIYAQSARGPNTALPDILKPDVTAPGVDILGAQTRDVANGVRGERFQYLSGTSMAAPHVAGIAALLKEAHPDWSPAALRSALVTTARQDVYKEDGATLADAFDFGGGHIVPDSAVEPGLVYDANSDDYDAFLCGAAIPVVTEERCAALAADGFSAAAADLNLPSIAVSDVVHGRSIRRHVTNVGAAATWQAVVAAPPGVAVSVSPPTLSLAAGETADFTVAVTNLGDASRLDSWNEGALTWVSGRQSVRSPLVVAPAAFGAAASVGAATATGSADVTVDFGYAGVYSVSVVGLAAATRFQGFVTDDPLNLYTIYEDDSALPDHIRRFHVTVAPGTRYLRVATASTDAGADDIDLYLLCPGTCPDGSAALASTGFDTSDEVIDILDPAPGVYAIDVHGYDTDDTTGGPGANFEVGVWALANAGGEGSFAVTAAPAIASIGASGEVTVAWQDLQPGGDYLGLVTHADGERDLGYTLVEVVTP